MNNISEFNKKVWYRALKVIYILILALALFIAFILGNEENLWMAVKYIIGVIIAFELVKRFFYYIALGKFIPENTEWKWCKKARHFFKVKKRLFIRTLCMVIALTLVFGGVYWYFNLYQPSQVIKNFPIKWQNDYDNRQPKTAKEFLDFAEEEREYREIHNIPKEVITEVFYKNLNDFIEKYPDEAKYFILTEVYEKDGLKFNYPPYLQISEVDGNEYVGFNAEFTEGEVNENITLSKINLEKIAEKCTNVASNYFLDSASPKEKKEYYDQKLSDLKDAFKKTDNIAYIDPRRLTPETYNCGYMGHVRTQMVRELPDREIIVLHKVLSQSSESACALNTQVLISIDELNFYQINFNYLFNDFKDDCENYWKSEYDLGRPERVNPLIDSSEEDWSQDIIPLLRGELKEGDMISSKYTNLSKNIAVVNQIIETIVIENTSI